MAANIVMQPGYRMAVVVTDPATPASGDPVRYGAMTGIALLDEGDGNVPGTTYTVVDFGPGVYSVSVKGVDAGGNAAVSIGDAIFYGDADTPKLTKKSSGYFFGFALEAVDSGATATIKVAHVPSPGAGTLGTGTVGTTQLANGAVTKDKIAGTGVNGDELSTVADKNAVGGVPVIHRIAVASGANGDIDTVLTYKTRVIDAWVVMKGAGTAGATVTIKNGTTNAITDAIDVASTADTDIVRAGKINDAYHEIATGGTLRVSKASTGGDFAGAEVYVMGILVA